MSTVLEGGEQLERELAPEPMMAPAAGSLVLHLALAACLLTYGLLAGLFHHNQWGNAGSGGAIQVSLTSALPLPSDQPPNENVLATDTPSQAPAEPTPKAKQAIDETAIPITGKQKKQQQESARKTAQHQPEQSNRAQYGEQAGSSMARSMQTQGYTSGQTTVSDGDFGIRFGWYLRLINRKMDANGYRALANPQTPKGAKAQIEFKIYRDGSHRDVRLDQSSGNSSWDDTCVRAAQRVDTFGQLPPEFRDAFLQVYYDCDY